MISTRNPNDLPSPNRLRELCKALALLDEIIEPQWEHRDFSYSPRWYHGYEDMDLAAIHNGSGDSCYIVFAPAGIAIRGNTLHSFLGRGDRRPLEDDVFYGLPAGLEMMRTEPAFEIEWKTLTFAIWQATDDTQWRVGRLSELQGACTLDEWLGFDGSEGLLWAFDDNPITYATRGVENGWKPLDVELVAKVYRHETITEDLILALNPEAHVEEVMESAEAMGFMTSRTTAESAQSARPRRARCSSCTQRDLNDCPYERGAL